MAAAAAAALQDGATAQPSKKLRVAMLIHPDMVLLDLVGPQTVFSLSVAEIHLLWKERAFVTTDVGVPLMPTTTFADCPEDLDVLFVPGGLKGSVALMQDRSVLDFLARKAETARFVTSVCTGALVLGAAGLLRGYRATSHWYVRDLLALMGATVVPERVVVDRNRITGGGVTAGIDAGLTIAAQLRGEDYAKRVQLVLEYEPKPPFDAGSPERAGEALVSDVLQRRSALIEAARVQALEASKRL
jgi:cyclohexyl-isocyanide hydratase